MLLKDEFSFMKKSKVKAGEGKKEGKYPFFTSSDTKILFLDDYLFDDEAVIIGTGGMPSCNYYNGKFSTSTDNFVLKAKGKTKAKTLYYFLRNNNLSILEKGFHGAGLKHIGKDYLENVVLPSIAEEEQKTLIADLDSIALSIKKIDELLIKQDELVKSRFIELFGDVNTNTRGFDIYKIGSQFELGAGGTPKTNVSAYWENGTISWIGSNMCQDIVIYKNDGKYITEEGFRNSSTKLLKPDTVLVALVGATIGKTALLKFETTTNQNVLGIWNIVEAGYNPYFVFYYMQSIYHKFVELGDSSFKMASKSFVGELDILKPDIELQNDFAEFVKLIDKSKFILQKQKKNLEELFELKLHQYFGD